MPRLTVDLAEAQKREALPDGAYECTVYEVSEPRKGPKSSFVEVQFEVAEGEFAGRRFFRNCPITGKGAGMFAEFYEKVTGEELEFGEGRELDVDTDDLIGLPIVVVNKQQEYEGEMQNNVAKLLRSEAATA